MKTYSVAIKQEGRSKCDVCSSPEIGLKKRGQLNQLLPIAILNFIKHDLAEDLQEIKSPYLKWDF